MMMPATPIAPARRPLAMVRELDQINRTLQERGDTRRQEPAADPISASVLNSGELPSSATWASDDRFAYTPRWATP